MAVKYRIEAGAKHLNSKAKNIKEIALEPLTKGMRCKTCKVDSYIKFYQHQAYAHSGSVDWRLDACCIEFEQQIYQRLGVNRQSQFQTE